MPKHTQWQTEPKCVEFPGDAITFFGELINADMKINTHNPPHLKHGC